MFRSSHNLTGFVSLHPIQGCLNQEVEELNVQSGFSVSKMPEPFGRLGASRFGA